MPKSLAHLQTPAREEYVGRTECLHKKNNFLCLIRVTNKQTTKKIKFTPHGNAPWNPWGGNGEAGFYTGLLTYLELLQLFFIHLIHSQFCYHIDFGNVNLLHSKQLEHIPQEFRFACAWFCLQETVGEHPENYPAAPSTHFKRPPATSVY